MLLVKEEIKQRLSHDGSGSLFIDPLLDEDQIGEVTIDLRVGYDFLVSILTRKSFISVDAQSTDYRSADSYFQATRREVGDKFILYPGQIVLTTTLEYIALPPDVYADVFPRSSYSRLGIGFYEMIQPGFRGCFPLEMSNHSNNPVELVVGSRVVQARLTKAQKDSLYQTGESLRKYFGVTRPIASRAARDKDILRLSEIRKIT